MKTINSVPPNYEKIVKALPAVAENDRIIFTYGDTVYTPQGGKLSRDLEKHEQTHINQQSVMGKDEWWDKYLVDPKFRFEQELEAYRNQYFSVIGKDQRKEIMKRIAKDLSSDWYGNVTTREEAKKLIKASRKNERNNK